MFHPATEALIQTLLEQGIAIAGKFKVLLMDEQRACYARDINQIEKITSQKQQLTPELFQLKDELTRTMMAAQLTIGKHFENAELNQTRDKYLQLLEECQQLNQNNRSITASVLNHTHQTLDFLRRSIGYESIEHYGKDGIHHLQPSAGMNIKA